MSQIRDVLTSLEQINVWSAVVRIVLATLIGGCIGMNRGRHGRVAGTRTHILVCLGAAVTTLVGFYTAAHLGYANDPLRMGAQVISGVGFLGVGTIVIRNQSQVKGLTTAAGLWTTACIGLAIGAGFYIGALLAFVFVVLAITLFSHLETYLIASARNMNLYVEYYDSETLGRVIEGVKKMNVKIYDVEITKNRAADGISTGAILSVRLPRALPHAVVMAEIASSDGVKSVEEL